MKKPQVKASVSKKLEKKILGNCLVLQSKEEDIHSGQKCLHRVACLWSKTPMFQRAGMKEGGLQFPLAFQ